MEKIMLKIVFDNLGKQPVFKKAWGYSCLVEKGKHRILFDTGSDGEILLDNLKEMDTDLKSIQAVVISHEHWDHIGGLEELLKQHSKLDVYVPHAFSEEGETEITNLGAKVIRVRDKLEIADRIYSLGEMQRNVPEQSLLIDSEKGTIIITGCAHPGILEIIKRAKIFFANKEIFLVMGGFHLKDFNSPKIEEIAGELKKIGVKHIAPSHCSGDYAIRHFDALFGDQFIAVGAGEMIVVN